MQSEQVEQHTTLTPLAMSVSEMSYDPPQRQVSEYNRLPVDREAEDTHSHVLLTCTYTWTHDSLHVQTA